MSRAEDIQDSLVESGFTQPSVGHFVKTYDHAQVAAEQQPQPEAMNTEPETATPPATPTPQRSVMQELFCLARLSAATTYIGAVRHFWSNIEELNIISGEMTDDELTPAEVVIALVGENHARGARALDAFAKAFHATTGAPLPRPAPRVTALRRFYKQDASCMACLVSAMASSDMVNRFWVTVHQLAEVLSQLDEDELAKTRIMMTGLCELQQRGAVALAALSAAVQERQRQRLAAAEAPVGEAPAAGPPAPLDPAPQRMRKIGTPE